MVTNALLVEIGCEELPPKSLKKLGESFGNAVGTSLKDSRFNFTSCKWFASPRRLAVLITELAEKQTDISIEKKGPPIQAAYDKDGNPTKAALGWARSNNIDLANAQIVETPKGKWLQVTVSEAGKNLNSCLNDILQKSLNSLPIPKMMRWGSQDHQFVRPVHNICCLYGQDVLSLSLYGVESNNLVLGHRFHSKGLHPLDNAENYEGLLESIKVVPDFAKRKEIIEGLLKESSQVDNAIVSYDDDLLEEVCSLVEWPVLLKAHFEESFLEVPKEALIYTMKDDQKYFPLLSAETGNLLNQFYLISNIESSNPHSVVSGNEKVVRPRLADAQFFFQQDLKTSIVSRLNSLKNIVYQKQLGTVYDKSVRIANLSKALATMLNLGNPDIAYRAGEICKSDLTSKMVFEFPEVQGYMGTHYARHEGELEEIANAIAEHYKPRNADDTLPVNATSQAVALAEKFDTLVGIFGIGQKPKGDKDPFALRRAVLGIVKIVLEHNIALDLNEAISLAASNYDEGVLTNVNLQSELSEFFYNRIENLFVEKGLSVNLVRSVLSVSFNNLVSAKEKLEALSTFVKDNKEVVDSLVASNKRIANILKKSANSGEVPINSNLFENDFESVLSDELSAVFNLDKDIPPSMLLVALSKLEKPINDFFDNVMVNAEDSNVKKNRLALLQTIRSEFLAVADFSLLQG